LFPGWGGWAKHLVGGARIGGNSLLSGRILCLRIMRSLQIEGLLIKAAEKERIKTEGNGIWKRDF